MTKAIQTQIMLVLAAAVVLFLCTSPVLATIHFKDGGVHNIYYHINDFVMIDVLSPGLGTTLNILNGATIPYPYRLIGWEDSIINILGGSVWRLEPYDSSQVTVSGGSMDRDLSAYDSSQVTVSGGLILTLVAYNNSQVTVSGGSMGRLLARGSSQVTVSGGSKGTLAAFGSSQVAVSGGSMAFLDTKDSSQVTVSGGSISHDLFAYDSSQVAVSGGSINSYLLARGSSQVTVSGGSIGIELRILENAVLTMHGWDFAVDGTPVGYTELYSIFGGDWDDEPYRQLTGTLLSGDPINNGFRIGNDGKIVLVPEPASAVILGLGGFFLVLRRRRRQA